MDGIIVVDKPKGCTSQEIVYKLKKIKNSKVRSYWNLRPNGNSIFAITNW